MRSLVWTEIAKPLICAARWCALGGAAALSACVPADEAIGLGSVQFTFRASPMTQEGVAENETVDRWSIRFDRVVLGFKTMTIGQVGVSDVCSYRGRGAVTDVVFDPRLGIVQTFNGLQPVHCPDVGIIFGPPWDTTTLGNGATSRDLIDLATGHPAHAIIEATANQRNFGGSRPTLRIALRFDTDLTSSRFGGCRAAARGVRILEGERDEVSVRFAAERLFGEAISTNARLRVAPFAVADREWGNDDGIVTMDELDRVPLGTLASRFIRFYQLPNGTTAGSFGDFVRVLFRFTIMFRNEGICVGNEPGAEEGAEDSP